MTPAAGYSGYRLETGADTSNRGGTGLRLREMFGIGSANQAGPAETFAVRSDILAAPQTLALARVDTTTGLPSGTPVLTLGDASGARALQDVSQTAIGFQSVGNLGAATVTLGDFATQILSGAAHDAANVATTLKDRQALQGALQTRSDSVSGVNMDEELANMVVLQNAYNASGRVLTTAKEMFDALLQFV
jgi:flagellar hook-associated protein 1 FlgK